MAYDGSIKIDTDIDQKKFSNAMGKLGKTAKSAVKGTVLAIGAISTALAGAGAYAIKLGSDMGETLNKVDIAFEKNSKEMKKWSESAIETMGISKSEALDTASTFKLMGDGMGIATDKGMDMAQSLSVLSADMGSLFNTSQEMSKTALAGIYTGEGEALKKYGVVMTEANLQAYALSVGIKKKVNQMTQAEKVQLRYNYVLKQTEKAQGDFARTAGTSLPNQLKKAQAGVKDLASDIGTVLLPMALEGIQTFNGLFGIVKEGFEQAGLEGAVGAVGTMLGNLIVIIAEKAPAFIEAGITLLNNLLMGLQANLPLIVESAIKIISTLVTGLVQMLPQLLEMGIQLIIELALGLAEAIPDLIPVMVDAVMTMVDTLLDNLDMIIEAGIELILALILGIIDALPDLIEKMPEIIAKVVWAIIKALPKIVEAGWKIIVALVKGLVEAVPKLVSAWWDIVKMIPEKAMEIIDKIKEVGKNIVKGFWEGIKSAGKWIKDKVTGFFGGIVDGVKGFFGIESPSKLMRDEIGINLVKGIGVGFDKGLPAVYDDMQNSINMEMSKLKSDIALTSDNNVATTIAQMNDGDKEYSFNIKTFLDGKQIADNTQKHFDLKSLRVGG